MNRRRLPCVGWEKRDERAAEPRNRNRAASIIFQSFVIAAAMLLLLETTRAQPRAGLLPQSNSDVNTKLVQLVSGATPANTLFGTAEVTDLGTLGGDESFGFAINNLDQVVGLSRLAGNQEAHLFLYDNGQLLDLSALNNFEPGDYGPRAHAINDSGQVAAIIPNSHAAILLPGQTTDLGTLGGIYSVVLGINNSGRAVGYYSSPEFHQQAFVYDSGTLTPLGPFGAEATSVATAINDSGMIVGSATDSFLTPAHAFLYANGVMIDISPLANSESYAYGINNQAQVVGSYLTADHAAFRAFLYNQGLFTDIGTANSRATYAYGINDQEQVVGISIGPRADSCRTCSGSAPHAFIYENGVMTELNTLLPTSSGWDLNWAFGINNGKKIAGYGTINGQFHAFLLNWSATPTPAPTPVCSWTQTFADITSLSGIGWIQTNNSTSIGTANWFRGNKTVFGAQSAPSASYIAANFNSTTGNNTISNWLIIPQVSIQNGTRLRFYTRNVGTSGFPDRLQVRMSTNGASSNVGTTATDVGDFTTLLLDINPTYANFAYPTGWTRFTAIVTGLQSPVTGRLAFRYFVENGGPSGTRGNYLGIDTVSYDCAPPPNVSLSGAISYCSNPDLNAVPGVLLTLAGSASGTTLSDSSGNYVFSPMATGGNYVVTPSKNPRPVSSSSIATIDLVAIQRHLLDIGIPLSGCALNAADVTDDNVINTADVIACQRFILGQQTGVGNTGRYRFVPASRSYQEMYYSEAAQNFSAFVFGDVTAPFVEQ